MGCTLKPASNFSIALRFARNVKKYGDAFSKSSSRFLQSLTTNKDFPCSIKFVHGSLKIDSANYI